MTWCRLLNADEIKMPLMQTDDVQENYTILLCTSSDGDVKMPLIVFTGTEQLENPIRIINGRPIFEAYNDTHWNNALLHGQYLTALYTSLPPCSCNFVDCTAYCMLVDRFTGHFSDEQKALDEKHHVRTVVVEYTPEGQPNDDRFNGLIKGGVRARQADFWKQRQHDEYQCKQQGKEPPPPVTRAQNRGLHGHIV